MRIKGISWIEQHFEKLFAGIFGVALLGVLAWQFLSPEPTVKIGGKDVRIHSGYDEVSRLSQTVQGRIQSQQVEPLTGLADLVRPLERFQADLTGQIAPSQTLAGTLGTGVQIDSVTAPGGSGSASTASGAIRMGLPTIPGPEQVSAASYLASIHPLELRRVPELSQFVPSEAPHDAASVTVEGVVSGSVLRDALASDPDGDGPLIALRSDLWDGPGRLQLLSVELERQAQMPDGSWGETTTIRPMPGQFSLSEALSRPIVGVQGMRELIEQASRNAEQVRRPQFLAIFQGSEWIPPSERVETESGDRPQQIDGLRRRYVSLQRERDRLQRELDGVSGRPGGDGGRDPAPRPPAGGGGGGAGGAGGGGKQPPGGGDRSPRGTPPPAPSPAADQTRIRNLTRRIEGITSEQDTLIRQLRALGDDTSDLRADDRPGPGQDQPRSTDVAGLLDLASFRVWAHDLTVERGKTYRYRLRVVLNNPLFQQLALLDADQAGLASVPVVKTEPSAWSSPVGVEATHYHFVTSANLAETGLITRSAGVRAELFHFRWGFWRRVELPFEPGDRLEAELRVPDYSAIVRTILSAADNPDRQRSGEGELTSQLAEPPPIVLHPVKVDAAVLNVAPDPSTRPGGGDAGQVIAFLRNSAGGVVAHRPLIEVQSPMLRALRASAEQGDRAARPRTTVPSPAGDPGAPGGDRDPRQPQAPQGPIGPGGGSGLGGG
ncbi:MAG: hypothetical protein KF768_07155 [Phycisphaeraceae bacterium]|nr:hypothetical protein [Phycisphaeraceae bacterium]